MAKIVGKREKGFKKKLKITRMSCRELERHAQEPGLSPQHWRKQNVMRQNTKRNLQRHEEKAVHTYSLQVLHRSLLIPPPKSTVKHYHDGNRNA